MYEYRAKVVSVYDGDSIHANVDLGFKHSINDMVLRLYGIDAPEIRGVSRPAGLIARDYLRKLILNKSVVIRTHKDKAGKYGRYLCTVYLDDLDVNREMVNRSLAVARDYK